MESTACEISQVDTVTPELVEAFERLLPQLSATSTQLTFEDLRDLIGAPGTVLLIARSGVASGGIVGSATWMTFRIPSGRRARLESVVVDAAARARGIGAALCRAALARAAAAGVSCVDLTSSPSRGAANRLYEKLGFAPRTTNAYRYTLNHGPSSGVLSGAPDGSSPAGGGAASGVAVEVRASPLEGEP
jgi:ribosomal protein S18 acetylase RimI-like enzyme